jgi:hypothetical protein
MMRKYFSIMVMLLGCVTAVGQTEKDLQQVFFPVGSAVLNENALPQSLVDSAEAVCARGDKYTVLGVASPEGSYKANVRLAKRRAQAIVEKLSKKTGLPDSMFNVKTLVTGVDKLRELASQDENLPEKEKVLEILAADGSTGATLAKLKKLGDGTPYLYIKDRLFPYLRASVMSNKELEDFHPDLAGVFQPQITHRDYTKRLTAQSVTKKPSAVTQKNQSRHSSYNNAGVSEKTDTVKAEKTPSVQPTAPVKAEGKYLTEKQCPEKTIPSWVWIIIALLILALLALVNYYRHKVARLNNKLGEAQDAIRQKDLQLKNAQQMLDETQAKMEVLKKEQTKSSLYNNGESLYNHLMIGGVTYEWTNEQIRTLIEYYKLQNYPLINRLESEYDNLPLNHILFEILVDMGKSDQEIQRIMNISQTTIRSYRFRIKNKKI